MADVRYAILRRAQSVFGSQSDVGPRVRRDFHQAWVARSKESFKVQKCLRLCMDSWSAGAFSATSQGNRVQKKLDAVTRDVRASQVAASIQKSNEPSVTEMAELPSHLAMQECRRCCAFILDQFCRSSQCQARNKKSSSRDTDSSSFAASPAYRNFTSLTNSATPPSSSASLSRFS